MVTARIEIGDLVESNGRVGTVRECIDRMVVVSRPHPQGGTFEYKQAVVTIDLTVGKGIELLTCDSRMCKLILKSFDRVLTSVETSD